MFERGRKGGGLIQFDGGREGGGQIRFEQLCLHEEPGRVHALLLVHSPPLYPLVRPN